MRFLRAASHMFLFRCMAEATHTYKCKGLVLLRDPCKHKGVGTAVLSCSRPSGVGCCAGREAALQPQSYPTGKLLPVNCLGSCPKCRTRGHGSAKTCDECEWMKREYGVSSSPTVTRCQLFGP